MTLLRSRDRHSRRAGNGSRHNFAGIRLTGNSQATVISPAQRHTVAAAGTIDGTLPGSLRPKRLNCKQVGGCSSYCPAEILQTAGSIKSLREECAGVNAVTVTGQIPGQIVTEAYRHAACRLTWVRRSATRRGALSFGPGSPHRVVCRNRLQTYVPPGH